VMQIVATAAGGAPGFPGSFDLLGCA